MKEDHIPHTVRPEALDGNEEVLFAGRTNLGEKNSALRGVAIEYGVKSENQFKVAVDTLADEPIVNALLSALADNEKYRTVGPNTFELRQGNMQDTNIVGDLLSLAQTENMQRVIKERLPSIERADAARLEARNKEDAEARKKRQKEADQLTAARDDLKAAFSG